MKDVENNTTRLGTVAVNAKVIKERAIRQCWMRV